MPVRETLGSDLLGLGLWLAAPVAAELAADPTLRRRLRTELDARGLEVVTLNGFRTRPSRPRWSNRTCTTRTGPPSSGWRTP
ncbi:hypothetical protein NKG94_45240 [Micromonospora sp. M12]